MGGLRQAEAHVMTPAVKRRHASQVEHRAVLAARTPLEALLGEVSDKSSVVFELGVLHPGRWRGGETGKGWN